MTNEHDFITDEWLQKVKHLLLGFQANLERNHDHSTTLNEILKPLTQLDEENVRQWHENNEK